MENKQNKIYNNREHIKGEGDCIHSWQWKVREGYLKNIPIIFLHNSCIGDFTHVKINFMCHYDWAKWYPDC